MNLRIAFVSVEDPESSDSFSGTTYRLVQALRQCGLEVDCLGPFKRKAGVIHRAKRLFAKLLRKRYVYRYTPSFYQACGDFFERRLAEKTYHCIVSRGTCPVAMMPNPAGTPLLIWSDGTFDQVKGGYAEYIRLSAQTQRIRETLERDTLHRADRIILTSNWAAESAHCHYGVPAERISVIPLGANRPSRWNEAACIERIQAKTFHLIQFLFIGVEPFRKGADRAVTFIEKLNAAGLPCRAIFVGFKLPPSNRLPRNVEIYDRLPHSDRSTVSKIENFFETSHFLILPSRADCSPVVIAEAASHALPVIGSPVGGIPEMVLDGISGIINPFETDSDLDVLIGRVRTLVENPDRWRAMARASYDSYKNSLNWETHVISVKKLIESESGMSAANGVNHHNH